MRYHVIAVDFDGTLAWHEQVSPATVEALQQVKKSGRKIALVTGREFKDLPVVFPEYRVFDYIVAENGALIHVVATGKETLLGAPPPPAFVELLQARGVGPISVGKVIVATWEPHEKTVLEAIKEMGLELQVIFNKGAVMVLPPGVNKAAGLKALLEAEFFSTHNVVAVGDAENDSAMLGVAELAIAVSNALPSLKERADIVTRGKASEGVAEVIESILHDEYISAGGQLTRHCIHLGAMSNGNSFLLNPYRRGILVGGVSGGGKSTMVTTIAEKLADAHYQFCLIDPEGDYLNLPGTVVLGDNETLPAPVEIAELLKNSMQHLVICLLSVPMGDRPVFFSKLLQALLMVRKRFGHPHWLLIDEAHHLLPTHAPAGTDIPFEGLTNVVLVTNAPGELNKALLHQVDTVITVGDNKDYVIGQFCEVTGAPPPAVIPVIANGEASVWDLHSGNNPYLVKYDLPDQLQQRHKRKYATGDMQHRSFIFTGPENKLRLRANNLASFVQLAEGVDDETWLFHLQRGDYRLWASGSVNDGELAKVIEGAEAQFPHVTESKNTIINYIQEKYTA